MEIAEGKGTEITIERKAVSILPKTREHAVKNIIPEAPKKS